MFFSDLVESSYSVYKDRREFLVKEVIKENNVKSGFILLFGDFEKGVNISFEQESTVYYFSGLKEPGLALLIDFDDKGCKSTVFVPNLVEDRKKWFGGAIEAT